MVAPAPRGRPRRRIVAAAVLAACTYASASVSWASQSLGDLDADRVRLQVDARGIALLTYVRADGAERRVLAWGAVNARERGEGAPQVRFRLDYTGGVRSRGRPLWEGFRDGCTRYDGPPLPFLVAACRAPDGSYWAVQRWQRRLPLRGVAPFRPEQAAHELHLSHWTGPLPVLEVSPNWTYGGRWQGLFGRLTYRDVPVFGFRTPSRTSSDPYARYVYIDTFNSAYGPGWRRDAAKVLHQRNGAFCFSFVPQSTPPHYPVREVRGPGDGERHRVTVMGPGVTPVVQWEGQSLVAFDAARDRTFDALFDRLVGRADKACAAER